MNTKLKVKKSGTHNLSEHTFDLSENSTFSDLNNCESKKYEIFEKGDIILSLSGSSDLIGLLLEGKACIMCIDENGHESISDFLTVGDSFGQYIIMPLESVEYIVVAESKCKVLFVNYTNVINNCKHNCENHSELIKKMLMFTSQRAQYMSLHINILSKKSLREKLLAYFEYLRQTSADHSEVRIPITFDRLASYLGADRSAVMREIRRMNNDGLIISDGRNVTFPVK
ncbi:MAG: Crp/Fnr family transcriptional regulator [Clostridia bacterium]|nr:Crp/Fnr family transcriptional regulator [Clostridia bacterium]